MGRRPEFVKYLATLLFLHCIVPTISAVPNRTGTAFTPASGGNFQGNYVQCASGWVSQVVVYGGSSNYLNNLCITCIAPGGLPEVTPPMSGGVSRTILVDSQPTPFSCVTANINGTETIFPYNLWGLTNMYSYSKVNPWITGVTVWGVQSPGNFVGDTYTGLDCPANTYIYGFLGGGTPNSASTALSGLQAMCKAIPIDQCDSSLCTPGNYATACFLSRNPISCALIPSTAKPTTSIITTSRAPALLYALVMQLTYDSATNLTPDQIKTVVGQFFGVEPAFISISTNAQRRLLAVVAVTVTVNFPDSGAATAAQNSILAAKTLTVNGVALSVGGVYVLAPGQTPVPTLGPTAQNGLALEWIVAIVLIGVGVVATAIALYVFYGTKQSALALDVMAVKILPLVKTLPRDIFLQVPSRDSFHYPKSRIIAATPTK